MRNGIIETAEDMQKIKQICQLQKKLDIAVKALQYYSEGTLGSSVAQKALKEIDEVGTSAKEEQ